MINLTAEIYDGREYFWQWDRAQKIKLYDVAPNTEMHFAYGGDTSAIVGLSYFDDENVYCDIPDILLQRNGTLQIYIYPDEATVERTQFPVLSRPRPEDYVYDDYRDLIMRVEKLENSGMTGLTQGENIKIENGIISVITTDEVEQDNTRPLTSAGAYVVVGNIEALLSQI